MQKWERQRIRGITPKNKCSSLSLTALQMYFGTFECNIMYDLWLVVFCSVLLIKFIETILLMIRLGLYYSVILTAKPRLSTKMVTAFIRRVFHIRGCICFWSFFFSDQRFFFVFLFCSSHVMLFVMYTSSVLFRYECMVPFFSILLLFPWNELASRCA